jgi:hypothetical protein
MVADHEAPNYRRHKPVQIFPHRVGEPPAPAQTDKQVAQVGGAVGARAGIAKQNTINTTETMKRFMGRFLLLCDFRFQQPLFRRLKHRQKVL